MPGRGGRAGSVGERTLLRGQNLQEVPVGVLDEVDAPRQFIDDTALCPVTGFQGLKFLGGDGHVGVSSPRR